MQSFSLLRKRVREHHLTLVSAGVAFYAFLAFIPALIIVVAVYGRVAEPRDIKDQVQNFAGALPHAVERFISSQITAVSDAGATGVSLTLVIALLLALWSASGGMAALLTGLSVALDHEEPEGFAAKRIRAIALTIGAAVVLCVVVFLVAALPGLISDIGVGSGGRVVVNVLRWPVLFVVMVASLGAIYRFAGDRPRKTWVGVATPGALVGAVAWVVVSAGFALYAANFATYSKTYGTLASIVIVLLWLYLTALAVLIGAEVDGESQRGAPPAGAGDSSPPPDERLRTARPDSQEHARA